MVFTYVHAVLVWLLLLVAALFMLSCVALMFCGGIGAFRFLFTRKMPQTSDTKVIGLAFRIKRASNILWWTALGVIAVMLLNAALQEISK